ncbi:unnamed protein product [Didymodactylos carnosus]|uniref:Uncharacterized protein n=1 Tax=Didymodactylos carnosus TaxID=1234261 RepID=A0A813XRB5_9BILA|nr:unnamed protein product [Didymodactylos carnosus]CAF0883167.1 unnamed protein product [Didymodactylos carnosus]CAF3662117.1 unnamed protein product [Didymodactylos carnosus]CAF3666586.1 unnamed protein product [Didymodactylos carnosus]
MSILSTTSFLTSTDYRYDLSCINEFVKHSEYEIIRTVEQRYQHLLTDCYHQLEKFVQNRSNTNDERLAEIHQGIIETGSDSSHLHTNSIILSLIDELRLCLWRLIEAIIELSHYSNDKSILSEQKHFLINIQYMATYNDRRAQLISQHLKMDKNERELLIQALFQFDNDTYDQLRLIAIETVQKCQLLLTFLGKAIKQKK